MRRKYVWRVIPVALSVGLIASACGSSGGDGSSSSKSPVSLMVIAALSGNAAVYPSDVQAAQSAAKAVNAKGGIQGRKIDIITCDSQRNPDVTEACGRKAVSDHVLAVIGDEDNTGAQYESIINAAGIPDVAPEPNAAPQLTSPMSFPIIGGTPVDTVAQGQVCAALGHKVIKAAYLNTPLAEALLVDNLPLGLKPVGIKVAGYVPVGLTQTDYAPIAATLMAGGTNCITAVITESSGPLLVQALFRAGYTGTIVLDDALLDSVMGIGKAANGVYFVGSELPLTETSNPGVQQYIKEWKAAQTAPVASGALPIDSWAAVHFIANIMQKASAITPANLVKALKASGETSIPPLVPFNLSSRDTEFPATTKLFSSDAYVSQVQDGKQVALYGGKPLNAFKIPPMS